MSKHGSYIHQLMKRLEELNRIGQSRHKAKIEEDTHSPVGIFGYKTMKCYGAVAGKFLEWVKLEYQGEWKGICDIPEEVIIEYLQKRSKTCSANTVSTELSALNKIFYTGVTFEMVGISRSYKNINRSRTAKNMDKDYNPNNYKDQILISKAFGLRRQSINGGDFPVKPSSFFFKGDKLYVSVIEKGGKFRNAVCLDKYKDQVLETLGPVVDVVEFPKKDFFKETYKQDSQPLFSNYTSKIDNHAFRREYAQELYEEIKERRREEGFVINENYRGYDKEVLYEVSHNLGHNRVDVVVYHYLT